MYGTDLSGPVSVDNDKEGVVIQKVPDVLSEEEISLLKQHFVQPDMAKEEIMLQNYINHLCTVQRPPMMSNNYFSQTNS